MSDLAIEFGALSASFSPESSTANILLPQIRKGNAEAAECFCSLLHDAGAPVTMVDGPECLYESDDYMAEHQAFQPLIVQQQALYVAPVLSDVPPPPGTPYLRLLDSLEANVFLTTVDNELHDSTRMLLDLLVTHRASLKTRVLDYGCGSGILALAALTLSPDLEEAHATDVVDAALQCGRRNARLNNIPDERLTLAMPWELPSPRRGLADVAVANMLPGPLISVASDLAARVKPGGVLMISGFRREDVNVVREAFAPCFELPLAEHPTVESDGGWVALLGTRTQAALPTADLSAQAVG